MKLIPYLYLPGNAEEAMHFYQSVFDGTIASLMRFKEAPGGMPIPEGFGDKVMHGQVHFKNEMIYFSDSEKVADHGVHSISIDCESEEEIDTLYAALSQGATVHLPLDRQFWGAKYAKLTDKYGVNWDMNYTYPTE